MLSLAQSWTPFLMDQTPTATHRDAPKQELDHGTAQRRDFKSESDWRVFKNENANMRTAALAPNNTRPALTLRAAAHQKTSRSVIGCKMSFGHVARFENDLS